MNKSLYLYIYICEYFVVAAYMYVVLVGVVMVVVSL